MAATLNLGTGGNWAAKEGSLLAYNDENGNFKPLPFDFTRASSATRVNSQGLIEVVGSDQPRVDYSSGEGALLLEPSRSNLILTSAEGEYGNYPASGTNIISPDGTNNAVIPTPDSSSDRYQYTINGGTYSTNTKLSYSWYRKRISTPILSYIGDLDVKGLVNCTQVGSTTQIATNINGFDRFEAVFNITDGSAPSIIRGYFGGIVGTGNSSVAYFGHQLEEGSYATSYIPTSGAAVTRVADTMPSYLDVTPLNIGNSYTLFLDVDLNVNEFNKIFGEIVNSSNLTSFTIREWSGGIRLYNAIDAIYPVIAIASSTNKFVIRVDGSSYKIFVQGSSLSGTLTTQRDLGSLKFYGQNAELKINNFTIDDTALSDAECEALVN